MDKLIEANVALEEADLPAPERVEVEVDGRTMLGKRLKGIEDRQAEILKTLAEHAEKIKECSIQR